ncbi:MAG: Glycosyl transferase family protein [Candidatus Giovannonibacteria bacterium GW2011_GWC2_44_9]|uniref:dolichyl-phosphate beta-glucosyltransferase n=3 Tax=Candidatus Giovannoniibacteriota TaxID=1752738 RepID=A0A0G1L614_9BACT|nr:MAG: Glycosyl transferase family protein [Candidatus Giovannonibacteria bacterium GW2011_GWB1_44_23]KKT64042.1 MAG: Glycosyl transferase family protein [Candidatus Giovannonibacteria bacterium GW2011_GWA1_44_29]KKT83909.1 MAG: Glycosyl transferase family protein [Candidatus Giovannonibacteria bacterium GW2011_GWC2_44_9]KKT91890.1 MAG: Glycosyl transferase family protein [Parcubacteria group bacterium GW2011_GWC1_45_13]
MPKPDIYLSVIVPAYNEAEKLPKTLRRFQEYFLAQAYSYEILVVNDGSRDRTPEIINEMTGEIKNLRFIDRKKNMGKGYTVREGMLTAYGRVRLFADADNATDISHFDKMRPLFDKGFDAVICSRNAKDAPGARQAVAQAWWKRVLGNLGNLYIQWIAVPGIWDTQCGFKAFRDFAAEKIFSAAKINRWAFDVETLALAKRFEYKIGIIPANWVNDPRSAVKFTAYFRTLWEVFKIRRSLNKLKI